TLLRINPTRALRRTVSAFDARARGVAWACAQLLQSPDGDDGSHAQHRLRRRIHGQEGRLAETALMVEGWAAQPASLPPGQSAAALRRQLLEAQQALDAIITTTEALSEGSGRFRVSAGHIARRLASRDDAGAMRRARELKGIAKPRKPTRRGTTDDPKARQSAYRFAKATMLFV